MQAEAAAAAAAVEGCQVGIVRKLESHQLRCRSRVALFKENICSVMHHAAYTSLPY